MQFTGQRPHLTLVATALALALTAAGCGSSKKSSTTTPAAAPSASGAVALSADPGGALKFNTPTLKAKAGKVTIAMTNPSSSGLQHGIAVEGNGVDKDAPIVAPGKTTKLTLKLKPGKYDFYCPFDGHKAQGMKGTLVVK